MVGSDSLLVVMALSFLRGVSSFQAVMVPPSYYPRATSTTAVFGFRSTLKRRLLSPFRRSKSSSVQLEYASAPANVSYATHEVVSLSKAEADDSSSAAAVPMDILTEECPEHFVPFEEESSIDQESFDDEDPILAQYPADTLYSLPELDRDDDALTPLELEFRAMLADFTHYSARDILSLRDLRMRLLFHGVIASADEPAVYRAFEVLFEDLYPLRVGGRVIYRKLKNIMQQSMIDQQEEVEAVAAATGLEKDAVREARWSFLAVAMPLNGDAYLTHKQLTATGLTDTAVNLLGFDSAEAFLERVDTENKGRLGFTEMMLGLHQCAEEVCAVEACNAAETVRKVVLDLVEHPPALPSSPQDAKRQKNSDRYDEMVQSFRDWEGLLPAPEDDDKMGRRQRRNMEVIRGCFHGAENPHIVDALRVLYTDYSPLRVAGDIIFGIVSSIMKKREKNQALSTTR